MFSDADIERFSSRFEQAGADDCWNWTYIKNPGGHGRMWASGRNTLASHIALHMDGKPRPSGLAALHSCDNPACVNPKHLRWGTQTENIADRVSRNRSGAAHGERNGAAKLNAADVLKIRADQRSSRVVAALFGVSQVMVCKIKTGKAWAHVSELDAEEVGEAIVPGMFSYTQEKDRTLPVCNGG